MPVYLMMMRWGHQYVEGTVMMLMMLHLTDSIMVMWDQYYYGNCVMAAWDQYVGGPVMMMMMLHQTDRMMVMWDHYVGGPVMMMTILHLMDMGSLCWWTCYDDDDIASDGYGITMLVDLL
ncbi:hypothetical protein DPMN_037757 [Dreissena polymorpha]|uniref:Uncharacterized protein n=1 Tax=Dreissena polymorpha TaxID=45954 RepID=A0A9D4MFN6_DREPO|nr:hypothetical protein DPMN_037757 [Dreissena polymorpha]